MQSMIRRPVAALVAACMLAVSLPAPVRAGETPSGVDRQRIEGLVVKALVDYGVDPAQARARAAALTDEEAARVAAEIDKLTAGGNPVDDFLWKIYVAFLVAALLVWLPIFIIAKIREHRSQSQSGGGQSEAAPSQSPEPRY